MLDDDALLEQPDDALSWTAVELHEQHVCWIKAVDRRSDWAYPFRLQSSIAVELVPLRLRTPEQDGIEMGIPSVKEQILKRRSQRLTIGEMFLFRDLLEYVFDVAGGEWRPKKACTVLLKDVCILDCPRMELEDELFGTPEAGERLSQIELAHLYAENAKSRFLYTVRTGMCVCTHRR